MQKISTLYFQRKYNFINVFQLCFSCIESELGWFMKVFQADNIKKSILIK